jgi:hypothetical protein
VQVPVPPCVNKTVLGVLPDVPGRLSASGAPQPPEAIPLGTVFAGQPETPPKHRAAPSANCPETIEVRLLREANRGVAIMILGIISCACSLIALIGAVVFAPFITIAVVSLPTGILAWVMGHQDRAGIGSKRVSEEGASLVLTGYVCGIVGTSSAAFMLATCALVALLCIGLLAQLH